MSNLADAAREAAISVEAKLAGFSKRGDGGLSLRFTIHPNDIVPEIMNAPLGTRYLVALVELDDNEEPKFKPLNHLAQQAALLCKEPLFWNFLTDSSLDGVRITSEEMAINKIYRDCAISSRREIRPGTTAALAWQDIVDKFKMYAP